MKRIMFLLSALVLSMSLFAQQPQRGPRPEFKPEDMATHQADRIKKACDTNDEQYKALYGFFLRQATAMQAERKNLKEGERPTFNREDMEKRRAAQNDSIKAILTADQWTKYEKMCKEQQSKRRKGPRPNGPAPHPTTAE